MNGSDGRGREDKEEKIMSTVLTIATLQTRSDWELQTLTRKVQYDLECSAPGSAERHDALATLENISRVMARRTFRPRPPGF
jgi:hypothetical protein